MGLAGDSDSIRNSVESAGMGKEGDLDGESLGEEETGGGRATGRWRWCRRWRTRYRRLASLFARLRPNRALINRQLFPSLLHKKAEEETGRFEALPSPPPSPFHSLSNSSGNGEECHILEICNTRKRDREKIYKTPMHY